MNIPRFSVTHRPIILAFTALMLVWGMATFLTMSRREDPEFKIRFCQIYCEWPGATARKVEQLICRPLEREISAIDDVKNVRSEAHIGYGVLYVQLEDRVTNLEEAWSKVRSHVDLKRGEMPEGAQQIVVNTEYGDMSIMCLTLYQPFASNQVRYTNRELKYYARLLRDEIWKVKGVAKVEIYGLKEEVIYIETDVGRWSQLQLSASELQQIVSSRNIIAPGGSIDTQIGKYGLKPSGELESPAEIADIAVNDEAAPVVIGDLELTISRRYEEPPRTVCRFALTNGAAPCVIVGFTMKDGFNVVKIGKEVGEKVRQLKETLFPPDLEIGIMSDSPTEVDAKVNDFVLNLLEGVAAVILVSVLMMSFRASVIMAAAIPLSMIGSIGMIKFFGVTLDQVSIASLIIALGMLVDNAIVVSDNVIRLQEQGESRLKAAWRGAQELAFPVLSSTLTTVAAFLPMLTIPGSSGEYMSPLPIVVSTTLCISYLVAMTVTPMMCYVMLRPADAGKSESLLARLGHALRRRRRKTEPQGSGGAGMLYERIISWALNHKVAVLLIAAGLFAASLCLFSSVGIVFFPESDRKTFTVDLYLPDGATIDQTQKTCRQIEDLIRGKAGTLDKRGKPCNRLVNITSFIGGGGPRFYLNRSPETSAANYALMVVNTISGTITPAFADEIRDAVGGIPGCRAVVRLLDMGSGSDSPLGIRLYGPTIKGVREQAEKLKNMYRKMAGVYGAYDLWGDEAYQVDVEIRDDAAKAAGVDNAAVATTLNAMFSGHYVSTYNEGEDKIPIYLRAPPGQRGSLDIIDEVYVAGSKGKVPLDAVAEVKTSWAPAKINRRDLERMCEVRAYILPGFMASKIVDDMAPLLEEFTDELPPRYWVEMAGEQENINDANSDLARALKISAILIVVVLIMQFNSFSKPFVVLLTIPLSLTGALVGLFIMQTPLDFMGMLGCISLAGVVVNNAIVLIDFIQSSVKAGAPLREAIIQAGHTRMRPIFLTSLTTIAGMLPLAIFGGPLWKALSYVSIFGLAFSTLLTLIVIPTAFCLFVEKFGVKVLAHKEA